jgi:hypothetical protein
MRLAAKQLLHQLPLVFHYKFDHFDQLLHQLRFFIWYRLYIQHVSFAPVSRTTKILTSHVISLSSSIAEETIGKIKEKVLNLTIVLERPRARMLTSTRDKQEFGQGKKKEKQDIFSEQKWIISPVPCRGSSARFEGGESMREKRKEQEGMKLP